MGIILKAILFAAGLSLVSSAAVAQSFSCRGGTQPACLDYGAKVCSSFSKCVSDDAVVFDRYQCDYKGFVCKSALDEVVTKHDEIVEDYNRMLREKNELIDQYNTLAEKSRNMVNCVRNATTVEDAQSCLR